MSSVMFNFSDTSSPDRQDEWDNHKNVWCRGDRCTVRWIGDGEVYCATIRKIERAPEGQTTALVRFDEYGSEDDVEVNIDELITHHRHTKRSKKQTMKTIEAKDEESERLRKKYEQLDKEEELEAISSPQLRYSWRTTSKSLVNDSSLGGHQKTRMRRSAPTTQRKKSMKTTTEVSPRLPSTNTAKEIRSKIETTPQPSAKFHFTDSETETDKDEKMEGSTHAGFDDEDLEKPRLSHSGPGPKEPLELGKTHEGRLVCVPATINQYLWGYQRDGVRFLYHHYRQGEGAILGDDMGLGKTVQVIAFLSALLAKTGTKEDVLKLRPKFIRRMAEEDYNEQEDEGGKKVFLIIGPASVLYNWVDELDTWGHFTVGTFHKQNKQQTLADLRKEKLDIVVTTFETCRYNVDALNRFEWDSVIADEVHKIKGMKAEITQALKALRCRRRFGLTGTALQNDMKELWCILDWANPGCLGTVREFEGKFEKVILDGQKQDATKRQLAYARKAKEKFAELRNQWFMRRTKAIIADQLPKKDEQVVYCRPTNFQVDVYRAVLGHPHIRLILTHKDPCPCASRKTRGKCCYKRAEDGRSVSQLLFSYLQMLLKTANHVALLMPGRTTNENQRKQAEAICDVAFAQHPNFQTQTRDASFRTLSDPKYCGKMKVLAGLLNVFKKEKCKVLLFSLSTQLLDIIEHYVSTTGYEYRRLDGKTRDVRRVQLVREFNKDPGIFLFLSSTRAGGVGLNLTGANVVVIYDPNWNPTHDLQAQDRAYRLGQGRDVRVFRLITMGTVEETIYLRQVYKQQLDRVAVSEENAKRLFHRDEIFGLDNLFKLRISERCLTTDILERNEKIETSIKGFTIHKFIPPTTDQLDNLISEETSKRHKRTGRKRAAGDEYGAAFVSSQIISSEDDNSDDAEYGEDDSMEYGDLEDDGSGTDDNSSSVVTPVTQRAPGKKTHIMQSDSEDDIKCGQACNVKDVSRTGRGIKGPRDACAECLRPTAGSSNAKTWQQHTCKKPGKMEDKNIKKWAGRRSNNAKSVHTLNTTEESTEDEQTEDRRKPGAAVRRASTLSEPAATLASVSDVFNQCKVAHRHQNQKLVCASKAEDHMTRCAIQDVYELHQHSQAPAAYCPPLTDLSEESDDLGSNLTPVVKQKDVKEVELATKTCQSVSKKKQGTEVPTVTIVGSTKVRIGQMRVINRKRKIAKMASSLGEHNEATFAQHVLDKDGKEDKTNTQNPQTKGKDLRRASRQKKHRTHMSPGVKGCNYISGGEESDQQVAAGRIRQKRNKRPAVNGDFGGDELVGSDQRKQTRQPEKKTHTQRLLDEVFDSDSEEDRMRKSFQRTVRKVKGGYKHSSKKVSKGNAFGINRCRSVIDDLFDSHDEKRKNAPQTPKKVKRRIEGNVVATNPCKRSVIDDLFDSDVDEKRKSASQTPKKAKRGFEGNAIATTCCKRSVVDDLFDTDSDEKRKSAQQTQRRRKRRFEDGSKKHSESNPFSINTHFSVVDDLFDSDSDGKQKSSPRTPKNAKKGFGENAVPTNCCKRSVIDDLFDTDSDEKSKSALQTQRREKSRFEDGSEKHSESNPFSINTPFTGSVIDNLFDTDSDDKRKNAPHTSKKLKRTFSPMGVVQPGASEGSAYYAGANRQVVDLFDTYESYVKNKPAPQMPKKPESPFNSKKCLHPDSAEKSNYSAGTSRCIIDDLFDSESDEKRKSAPKSTTMAPNNDITKLEKEITQSVVPVDILRRSVLDDLFTDSDDDTAVKKAAPKQKPQGSPLRMMYSSDGDLFSVTQTEQSKGSDAGERPLQTTSPVHTTSPVQKTSPVHKTFIVQTIPRACTNTSAVQTPLPGFHMPHDSGDAIFSCVTPTRPFGEGREQTDESSLDIFERASRVRQVQPKPMHDDSQGEESDPDSDGGFVSYKVRAKRKKSKR